LAPNETPPNPYADATEANTNPAFLNKSDGTPLLGDGVRANLDDLKGYSINLNEIQGNFAELGRSVADALRSMVAGAFPTGGNHGLEWEGAMNSLAQYNAFQFQSFVFSMALGVQNVARAAQAVANSYGNTDDTSAANLAAIQFAFGDKSKVPPGFPAYALEHIPTWAEISARNPPVPPARVPDAGLDPDDVTVVEDGNSTTTTVRLPGGGTMVTTEERWGAYGTSGTTTTVTVNGKPMTRSTTYTYGGSTYSEETEYQYDANGTATGPPRVVSSGESSVTRNPDGSERSSQSTTTYSYDDEGNATPSTSGSSVTVGPERPEHGPIPYDEDPAQRVIDDLMPDDEQILAPGPLGQEGGQQPPGTVMA
jgi:hypothetical protein